MRSLGALFQKVGPSLVPMWGGWFCAGGNLIKAAWKRKMFGEVVQCSLYSADSIVAQSSVERMLVSGEDTSYSNTMALVTDNSKLGRLLLFMPLKYGLP